MEVDAKVMQRYGVISLERDQYKDEAQQLAKQNQKLVEAYNQLTEANQALTEEIEQLNANTPGPELEQVG